MQFLSVKGRRALAKIRSVIFRRIRKRTTKMLEMHSDVANIIVGPNSCSSEIRKNDRIETFKCIEESAECGLIDYLKCGHAPRRRYILIRLCEIWVKRVEGCVIERCHLVRALVRSIEECT